MCSKWHTPETTGAEAKNLFLKREGHSVSSEAKQESIDIFNGGGRFSQVAFGEKNEIDFPPKPGISLISYLEIQGGAHSAREGLVCVGGVCLPLRLGAGPRSTWPES